jgi:very-short-patch-repair endonuclease
MNHKKKESNLVHMKSRRNGLRRRLTPAEAAFWSVLKKQRIGGRKFRRQHSIGNYVLDFYCPEEKLAIELDGEIHFHDAAREYDAERTSFLRKCGIRVLRFENRSVFEELDFVLFQIEQNFGWKEQTTPSAEAAATPPYQGGELSARRVKCHSS